jgi:hypothetical protein
MTVRSPARLTGLMATLLLVLSLLAFTGAPALARTRAVHHHVKADKRCQTKRSRRTAHGRRVHRGSRRCVAARRHRRHGARHHVVRHRALRDKAGAARAMDVGAEPVDGVENPFGRALAGVAAGGALQNESPGTLSSDLNADQAVGAKWLRIDVNWAQVQAQGPDSYDWTNIDAVVRGAEARGMNVLAGIVYTPSWARPAGTSATYGPDPSTYAAFAAVAVAHYAAMGVHAYEIWNEENIPSSWSPMPNPSAYAALLKAAYPAIKRADPSATVVTGGLAPAPTSGSDISAIDFLRAIYADGAGASFDAVGDHPYCWPAYPGEAVDWSAWYQIYGTATSLRSVMQANGDGSKRIWATEFGAPTGGPAGSYVSQATQAAMIARAISLWATYSWAGPLFIYQGRDQGTDPSSIENFFGFIAYDGTPKPAFSSFREAVATL